MVDLFNIFIHPGDIDGDGNIDIVPVDVLPLPGTLAAKKLAMQLDYVSHSPAAVKAAKKINPDATGMWHGKPLVPGPGPGQGDFDFVRTQIYLNGSPSMTWDIAGKIAGKAYWKQVGG